MLSTTSTVSKRLTDSQTRFFQDEGYLICPDIFEPSDLDPLRRELAERIARKVRQIHAEGKIQDTYDDEPFERRLTRIYHDSQDSGETIMHDLEGIAGGGHTGIEMFNVIRHPKLLAAVECLVGDEIVASSVYRIRPKIPGIGRGIVPWHQDSGYFAPLCDDKLILTVWIPLVDANQQNGCMRIVPRAHRRGVFTHHTGGNAGFLVINDSDLPDSPDKAITAACPLGGAVFMTNLTPHCSTPNHSDVIRWSVDLRYQSADAPNNVDLWPDLHAEPTEEVLMACYPPEADFIVQSRRHPERVCDYATYVQRREHFDRVEHRPYPQRGWTPVARDK